MKMFETNANKKAWTDRPIGVELGMSLLRMSISEIK